MSEIDCSELIHDAAAALREDGRTQAILLFGSAARHEAARTSDVDLLVLHRDSVPEEVLDQIDARVSISFYRQDRLDALPSRSPLFAIHLAREGQAIWDPDDLFRRALGSVGPLAPGDVKKLKVLTSWRLASVLRDPFFEASDDLSAGQLYALTKQAAMLASASQGRFEFNRHHALDALAGVDRSLRNDARAAALLEGAWLARRHPHTPRWRPAEAVEAKADVAAARVIARIVGHGD